MTSQVFPAVSGTSWRMFFHALAICCSNAGLYSGNRSTRPCVMGGTVSTAWNSTTFPRHSQPRSDCFVDPLFGDRAENQAVEALVAVCSDHYQIDVPRADDLQNIRDGLAFAE